jgi:two-component system NtrC family sensor kinase
MKFRLRLPIRYKLLLSTLLVITAVVSSITFTMANLFHTDKKAYIHDLTSVMALHVAEETRSLLSGYKERLQVFARLMLERDLTQKLKADMLEGMFVDFPDILAVALIGEKGEEATLYDAKTLEKAGLDQQRLALYRKEHPLPLDAIKQGRVYIENSTITENLPTLTMAIAYDPPEDKPVIISAVIRLNKLFAVAKRSKVFNTFIVDENKTLLVHNDPAIGASRTDVNWIPDLDKILKQRSLSTTAEYQYNGVDLVGGFAHVEFSGLLAAVQIPKSAAYLTARELLHNLIWVAFILLSVSALLSLFWSFQFTRPIERLSKATRVVAQGDFDIQVKVNSSDEIGDLAGSFNEMASGLKEREEKLEQAHKALVQSEKMSAFGQLSAGIAHEVKNPLTGILGYAQLSKRKVGSDNPLLKNLEIIERETKRCKNIIDNLMKFARAEEAEKSAIDLNEVVRDAVSIVDHQLTINKITLSQTLDPDLPPIMGNANQLQQVLMNFMINAQQAMNGKPGKVKIGTRRLNGNKVVITISDNGPGIAQDIQDKIFEPFFTTKAVGEGTGLGLSVSYGIIKDHNGEIKINSTPGKGATFLIALPTLRA